MDLIVFSIKWQLAFVYLGDISILLQRPHGHIPHVCALLYLYQKARAPGMLKACKSLGDKIGHVGHIIYPWTLKWAGHTTDRIWDLEAVPHEAKWSYLYPWPTCTSSVFGIFPAYPLLSIITSKRTKPGSSTPLCRKATMHQQYFNRSKHPSQYYPYPTSKDTKRLIEMQLIKK